MEKMTLEQVQTAVKTMAKVAKENEAYFCELDGERDIVLDTGELATAEWVHYSDVPEDPEGLSLTREMMSVFQKNFTSEKMS